MEKTFGELIQSYRKEKGWTAKTLIEQLQIPISPTYITKIEVHGEIPKPELICKLADLFNVDDQMLLTAAKQNKLRDFEASLEKKYDKAAQLYRTQKSA